MTVREVQSPGGDSGRRERARIGAVAIVVLGAVALYLALRSGNPASDSDRRLLPYQVLIQTLHTDAQQMYTAIRSGLPSLESARSATGQWPDPADMANQQLSPFSTPGGGSVTWRRFERGAAVNYFAAPADPSAPAWLLTIQEPEPNTPPDPAPLDDEHHRLPDGTTLHIYVWMHRFGSRVTPAFVTQPQSNGWSELLATTPGPRLPPR